MRLYAEKVLAATEEVIDELWTPLVRESSPAQSEGTVVDVYRGVNQISLSAMMSSLFGCAGVDGDCAGGSSEARVRNAITEAFQSLGEIGASPLGGILPAWVPTPNKLKLVSAVSRLDAVVYEIIRQKRRQQLRKRFGRSAPSEAPVPSDLLSALLDAFYDEKCDTGVGDDVGADPVVDASMLDKQMRDELLTLLVAGQETSALTVSWALCALAEKPSLASRVAEEARRAVMYAPGERMSCMPFTQACVLEAMRLFPPAYIIGRATSREGVRLKCSHSAGGGEYELEKGTTVLISPYVIHRKPEYWGQHASEFMPQRWLNGQNDANAAVDGDVLSPGALTGTSHDGAYIPFGSGPRNCIGAGFAMMETTLIVGEVLRRFQLSLPPGQRTTPKPRPFVTLRPADDKVMLEMRARQS